MSRWWIFTEERSMSKLLPRVPFTGCHSLQSLRDKGLHIVLDDFETGGGLLMPLLSMPVDRIKDR